MLALRHRLRFPAFVVALALFAGPAASAACLHALTGDAHEAEAPPAATSPEHAPMGEMAMEAPSHGTAPPCHDVPETPPAEVPSPTDGHGLHDCTSPCCLAEVPTEPATPIVLVSQAVAVPLATLVERDAEAVVPPVEPATSPPPRTARLHAVFQRFLI